MNHHIMPITSLPDEVKTVMWRIFGHGASPLNQASAYGLVESVIKKHAPSAGLGGVISGIQGWFESPSGRPWLKSDMWEPVSALILEGIRSERTETAIWAAGSIDDVDWVADRIRGRWCPEEIDSFVEATWKRLAELCTREDLVDASHDVGGGAQGSMRAKISKSAWKRSGWLETFFYLDNHVFDRVSKGLHPTVGNLLELVVELRPEQFPFLIDRLDHEVMQARAAHRMIDGARRVDHRASLKWIAKDSCAALVALAILHTLDTVHRLDEELRHADGREEEDPHFWSTDLRPSQHDVDAAVADLLTDLVDQLGDLEPLDCAGWMGELLGHAPKGLPGPNAHEIGRRNEQLERACRQQVVHLFQRSWSEGLLDAFCAGLRRSPRATWTRHVAEIAWALQDVEPVRAAEVARVTLDEHERYLAEAWKQNQRLFLDWQNWQQRQWFVGLGAALALSCEGLDLRTWVATRCQALPLIAWDAEECLEAFSAADRAAQYWFLIALHALPPLQALGRPMDPAAVRDLVEKWLAHCHFVEGYLGRQPDAFVVGELAARDVVEFGEPSDGWLLEQARDSKVGPCVLWALMDQRRLQGGRTGGVCELVHLASDRFKDGGPLPLEELWYWGLLWLALGAVTEAEQTARAILAFPRTEQNRVVNILALKLLALVAGKGHLSPALQDDMAWLYDQLWPGGYVPTEERADRQQIDKLRGGSRTRWR